MNTTPQSTPEGVDTNLDPVPDISDSGNLNSGGLDSGFFCELNGVTTQLASKSDNASGSSDASVELDGVEDQRTEIPPHKQGKNKVLLMTGLVSIPMLALAFMTFSGTSEPSKAVQAAAEAPPLKPKADFAPDPRFAVAQSKLAMQQQEQQLLAAAKMQQQNEANKPIVPPATATNSAPVTAPRKVESAPVTEPIASSPPTNVQPPILPVPTPTPAPIKSEPKPRIKPVETGVKPTPKPVVVATRASKSDSPVAIRFLPAPVSAPLLAPVPAKAAPQLSWKQATAGAVEVIGARQEPNVTAAPQSSLVQTVSPTQTQTRRSIIAGQNRIASLITPLQILSQEQGQEVLLNLEQGFVNTQGGMSIPANTKIQAQITVASNGMLRIGEAKVVVGGIEHLIATGNLMLVGTNNQPLVAELKQFNNGEINRRDMQTALIGGLQGLGKVLTQPNTQTQITTGGAAISTTNSNPNILGGILDGAASPIVQQWAQRNQQEVQRLESNARVWFLPAGSRISLYTTKPFEIK
jgi:hypothetical protein